MLGDLLAAVLTALAERLGIVAANAIGDALSGEWYLIDVEVS